MATVGASTTAPTVACPKCGTQMAPPAGYPQFRCPGCSTILGNPEVSVSPPVVPPASTAGFFFSGSTERLPKSLFEMVDTDNSGSIDAHELQRALSFGGWRPFMMRTIKMLLVPAVHFALFILFQNMFNTTKKGCVDRPQFEALYKYLVQWKASFEGIDQDKNGAVDTAELTKSFEDMGYRFSPQFYAILVASYDDDGSGSFDFDEFIQLNCELQLLTNQFKALDFDKDGLVTVNLEQFLSAALGARVM